MRPVGFQPGIRIVSASTAVDMLPFHQGNSYNYQNTFSRFSTYTCDMLSLNGNAYRATAERKGALLDWRLLVSALKRHTTPQTF